MDSKNHNDWTEAVRERLEGRELTPSDALWERIGAAVPQAGAPRKVRRLAWGGALGAAAAAALAAVLFLRPAGAPEDGRIDVVPTYTAPLAEQRAVVEPETVAGLENVAGPEAIAAKPKAIAKPVATALKPDSFVGFQPPQNDNNITPVIPDNVIPSTTDNVIPSEAKESLRSEESPMNMQVQASDVPAMTIEEYIAQDDAKRRHRSFSAAVYAGGLPSTGSFSKNDMDIVSRDITYGLAYADPGVLAPRDSGGSLDNNVKNNPGNNTGDDSGVTYNPENPSGFNPVKYSSDPYNLNGERLNHSRPVSAGLALTLPLDGHFFLESGLYYSYLHSTSFEVSDQSLHFLGIPLKAGWRFGTTRHTSLSLSAGAKAEKCLLAFRDGERFKEPGIQLAAVGSAAVYYDFTPRLGIFLAPELSYWFTETNLPTYNTEHPFNLSLKAGLNLTVGR